MNARFQIGCQTFVWDQEKALANFDKHGISFEKACEVFFDPFMKLVDASDNAEFRESAMGLTEDWESCFVVHLLWQGNAIRIISARRATTEERRRYENE